MIKPLSGEGKFFRIFLFFLILFSSFNVCRSEECDSATSRPVIGVYSLETGRENVLATYLSPLHYTGTKWGLSGFWSKAMPFNPENAVMHFKGGANFSNLLNPAHTARMVGITADFAWGLEWRKRLPEDLQLTLGGELEVQGGAYYLLRNGNNPVEALFETSLNISASLSRPFRIKNLPFIVSDRISLPSAGIFFAPEYGETYYEIYLGNHKGLVHPGWWGNNFMVDNLFSITFDFGRTAAMIGYRFDMKTQWANQLNTKIMTHSFVIGIIPGGIGLKNKKTKPVIETVSPLY